MSETKQARIARLLAEGLDHYGVGDVANAILSWEEVLVLDPGNGDAQDYIRTADRRRHPRPSGEKGMPPVVRSLLDESRRQIREERFEEALDLLRSAAEAEPEALEIQARLDLVRARLLRRYRERVGDLSSAPVVRGEAGSITRYNLPSDAGFLLSMVDGSTSAADLVSLSGMDAFEALRILQGLLDAGIVGMER